jgi:hypothetical protein
MFLKTCSCLSIVYDYVYIVGDVTCVRIRYKLRGFTCEVFCIYPALLAQQ